VATLSRKFERFDDRMTVQVKDQDQRLKKVEAPAAEDSLFGFPQSIVPPVSNFSRLR